jgi:hypothetical protein
MWVCENDQYCPDQTTFKSLDEFRAMVLECFPKEAEGMELRNSCGGICDEHGEVVLRHVDVEKL